MNETKNMPEKRFSTGAVAATVWQNAGKSKEGDNVNFRTISVQRRYKDKSGTWQSANSFRVNDLPKASLVLQKAYEYLVIREAHESSGNLAEDLIEEVI
ncbi:MAG: hypothetical protein AABX00_04015 [Nanoarchaeota archaeon]